MPFPPTTPEPLSDEQEQFVSRLELRLKNASNGDRMFERPMDWREADILVAVVRMMEAYVKELSVVPQNEALARIHKRRADELAEQLDQR